MSVHFDIYNDQLTFDISPTVTIEGLLSDYKHFDASLDGETLDIYANLSELHIYDGCRIQVTVSEEWILTSALHQTRKKYEFDSKNKYLYKYLSDQNNIINNINVRDRKGLTPLMYAVINNDLTIVDGLLQLGAQHVLDKARNSPLSWASALGHSRMSRLLLSKGGHSSKNDLGYTFRALTKKRKMVINH